MTDANQNGKSEADGGDLPTAELKEQKKERRIKLVKSRAGRIVSVAGLIERVVTQFSQEHGENSPALLEADTEAKRLKLVRDTAVYVFSVESVQLAAEEQADIIQQAYSELFGFGPLDTLFADKDVTTIALEGADKVAVRYGPGTELVTLDPLFEDLAHMQRIVRRMLYIAGAELNEDLPFIEAGFTFNDRAVSITVTGPPFTFNLTTDIRLHSANRPELKDWVAADYLPETAAKLLEALARSQHGFVIVGDTESGKTTLLSMLSQYVPDVKTLVSVERSGELALPEGATQQVVQWPFGELKQISLSERVEQALATHPTCLLLDEVRADETDAIAPLLRESDVPRQIWVFRGASDALRIRSALGMIARRADTSQPEAMVQALYRRLPFMVVLKKRRGKIEVIQITEWQFNDDPNYPDTVELMAKDWDGFVLTGKRPQHELDLPENFWDQDMA